MAFKKTSTITPFEKCIYLSSPTMHGDEARYMMEAYETNWMSTVGKNIDEVEMQTAEFVGVKHAVALSAGTAALHRHLHPGRCPDGLQGRQGGSGGQREICL